MVVVVLKIVKPWTVETSMEQTATIHQENQPSREEFDLDFSSLIIELNIAMIAGPIMIIHNRSKPRLIKPASVWRSSLTSRFPKVLVLRSKSLLLSHFI